MLNYLRKQAQTSWIKVILWVVVLSFVGTIFLVWGRGRQRGSSPIVASIDSQQVYESEFLYTYRNLQNIYRRLYGAQYTPELERSLNVRQSALDSIITKKFQVGLAEKVGFDVTNEELVDSIHSVEAFQRNGQFNERLYVQVLRTSGMSPQEFEHHHRLDLLAMKVENLVRDSVKVTDEELREAFAWLSEKAKVDYLVLDPVLFMGQVQVTDDEVASYYQAHREVYREPERLNVRYIVIRSEDFKDSVSVSPEEVERYYEMFPDEFTREATVHARHILLEVPPEAKPEELASVEARGKQILQELRGGADFAELARKYSEDVATASSGGDLGTFKRGEMGKEFEEVAFALAPGEISDLVRTSVGFHIIQVLEKDEGGREPLDNVRDRIVAELTEEKAQALAEDRAEFLSYKLTVDNFERLTKEEGLTVKETGLFAQGEGLPDIANDSDFTSVAFALSEDEVSDVFKDVNDFYLLKLLERKPSHIPELEEIKDRVAGDARRQRAIELAAARGKELYAQIKDQGKTLEQIAEEMGSEVKTTPLFNRMSPPPLVGSVPEFVEASFSHKPDEIALVDAKDKTFLIRVAELKGMDEEEFQRQKDEFASHYLSTKADEVFRLWLERRKGQAEINVNREFLF